MAIKKESNENLFGVKELLRDLLIIFISAGALYAAIAAYAGSLVPPGPAGSTMMSLEDIYNVLADPSYVPSGVAAKEDGNVLEILKCITNKMNGEACS